MKKKLLLLIMAMMLSSSVVACGGNAETSNVEETVESNSDVQNDFSDNANVVENSDVAETNNVSDDTDVTETNDASDEANVTEAVEETAPQTTPSATNGDLQDGKWVNFDNMQVEINGCVVTLGTTTLQELVDAGVPFDEDDLASIGNNIQSNHQSQGFKIVLGDYWSAQVYVGNYTDANAVAKDLPIVEVYLPNHPDETQDIIKFAFPTSLTEEELLANCGEPQDKDLGALESEYGTNSYDYTQESTMYYSDLKYSFEFVKGQLKYFTMTYLP